tara:strand:- start:1426 stop:2106 length:681 start_codon:yes stop_codon:yes gene_type:complete
MRHDNDCNMNSNADGVKPIFRQRIERNKLALKNLARPTPGKLGGLANLQIFNFNVSTFSAVTAGDQFFGEYNTTETTGNVSDCIMFGVDGIANKGLYYNIVDIKANVTGTDGGGFGVSDSFVQFYLLENIETSTTSLGRKIPRRVINGTSSGTLTFTTSGAKQGYQYVACALTDDSVNIPQSNKGLRASGIAFKTISLDFSSARNLSAMTIDFKVYVDVSSVSTSY